jgi:hypothetical protein
MVFMQVTASSRRVPFQSHRMVFSAIFIKFAHIENKKICKEERIIQNRRSPCLPE